MTLPNQVSIATRLIDAFIVTVVITTILSAVVGLTWAQTWIWYSNEPYANALKVVTIIVMLPCVVFGGTAIIMAMVDRIGCAFKRVIKTIFKF